MRTSSLLLLMALTFTACQPQAAPPAAAAPDADDVQPLTPQDIEITDGQTLYVPAYSHVYFMSVERPYQLAITLSVRNTDPNHAIRLTDVGYFDSSGQLVEQYATDPLEIGPMASAEFFVGQSDARGGAGANFLVTWESAQEVYEPLVEAAMVGTSGTQGISLLTHGRVYQERR